jgi:hypothetical protein
MPTPKKLKTLQVVCNPFAAIDHEGRCSGAFPQEPAPKGFLDDQVRHVGARRVVSLLSAGDPQVRLAPEHDHAFEFTHETMKVNCSDYYARAIKSGELLAADEETYAYVFGSKLGFREPHAIIAQKAFELEGKMPVAFGELAEEELEAKGENLPEGTKPVTRWSSVLAKHLDKLASAAAPPVVASASQPKASKLPPPPASADSK